MAPVTSEATPPPVGASRSGGFLRRFVRLAAPFFRGAGSWRAWLLAAGLIVLTLAQIAIQVRFNLWNRDFFNALEARDRNAFLWQMVLFVALAVASMGTAVYQLYVKQLLQLRWRGWLTDRLIADWLSDGRHYQLSHTGTQGADNPDQRIAEDARVSTEMAVEFAVGILNAVLMLVSFIGILWTLSGPLHVALASYEFDIPGYMVFAAIVYAGIGSSATWLVGRPMVAINVARNSAEGNLRFGLVRVRESGEGIALIRGEADERRGLAAAFAAVAEVWRNLMRSQRRLMWLTSAYGMLGTVFPTIVASPRYFAGAITLGGLMQIAAAFAQVQIALNWFVDNFPRIAEWRSSVERLLTFQDALRDLEDLEAGDGDSRIAVIEGTDSRGREILEFRDVKVAYPDGAIVIEEATARINAGERVLIKGESGTGKSTLFRAIAGLWPWGSGEIKAPPAASRMFMPQRPYLPLGSLRAAIAYPAPATSFAGPAVHDALARVGLSHLAGRLDETERWDRLLSLGEQQRLAFARLLLHRPRWVFMDEATAALDEANQAAMMELFLTELQDTAVISIGHRPGLEAYHQRTLTLVKNPDGARLGVRRRPAPARRGSLFQRLVRRADPA